MLKRLYSYLLLLFICSYSYAQTTVFTTQTPAGPAGLDAAVELGMKFSSSTSGFVVGVRFYKFSNMTGTHTGQLYTTGGTLLASVVFTGETATGWQTMAFSSPVAITAGTTYIIAVHMANGIYYGTSNGFAGAVSNPPLTAPANSTTANGVYTYSGTPAFPSSTFNASNYWVDVIFSTSAVGVNAGSDQVVSLPTTSTTLTATPIGTVTSYSWSQVSGPSAATIISPTSSSTSVIGLVVGNYIFQVSVNSNAASDQVAVQVKSQSSFSFPLLSGDFVAPNRGAEYWNGVSPWDNGFGGGIQVPAGNTRAYNAYYRFLWANDFEDVTQGVYSWTKFDQQIHRAMDSNQVFDFAVMPMCTACGTTGVPYLHYPQYLHTLMQGEASTSQDWFDVTDSLWIPNWNSPNYLGRYKALLQAIANHINTTSYNGRAYKDVIGYIDIRGYGDFGEWHTYPWYGTEPTGRKATIATLDSLISMNLQIFPNYPATIPIGVYDGGNASLTPPAVSYYALTATNTWGQIGWRRDQLGDPGTDALLVNNGGSYNPGSGSVAFQPLIMNKYKFAPIVGEPNHVVGTSGSPYNDLGREVNLYHISQMGNGNFPNTFDVTAQTNYQNASAANGYKLILTGGAMTSTTLTTGSNFNIKVNWQNIGVAPNYTKWNVVYDLRATPTSTPVWTGTSLFTPRMFLPQGNSAQSDTVNLIVIWGESNAAGNAFNTPLTTTERASSTSVQFLDHNTGAFANMKIGSGGNTEQDTFIDTSRHGMENEIRNLVDSGMLPNRTYVVKIGVSGSVICQWQPGGCIKVGDVTNVDLWTGWIGFVDSAVSKIKQMGKTPRIIVLGSIGLNDRFSQGISKSTFTTGMTNFITNFRARYNQTVPFFLTNFNNPPGGPGMPVGDGLNYDWSDVFTDSIPAHNTQCYSIPITGATYIDGNSHWDYNGFKIIVRNAFSLLLSNTQAASTTTSDNFILPSVPVGTYSLYMTVIDPAGYKIPLPLAIQNRNTDGSYLLTNGVIVNNPLPQGCNCIHGFKYAIKHP